MPDRLVRARTLKRELRFHCPDEAVAETLDYLSATPKMPRPSAGQLDIEIVPLGDGFYDFGGDLSGSPGTTSHMFNRADELITRQLLDDAAPDPIVMGGSLVLQGRRVIILSDDSLTKLNFMLNCLAAGLRTESDGLIVVHGDAATAIPRRIRVDRRFAPIFPELSRLILAAPSLVNWDGDVIHALAPDAAGVPWEISSGPVDVLVFLTPNPGGRSAAGRLAADIAFQRLVERVAPGQSRTGATFAKLLGLSRAAPCWRLQSCAGVDDLRHLEGIVSTLAPTGASQQKNQLLG